MLRSLSRIAVAGAAAAASLSAQAGNEIVFVGTSVGGGTDPHFFVASGTGALANQGGSSFTDNVTDAVWADTGRRLYVAQSIQPQVSLAQWNGTTPTWSVFYNAPGACYGLGLDAPRQRLWVLTGPGGSTRELVCLDADPQSAGYGTAITQTNMLGNAARERWTLSMSGNLAVVPYAFLSGGLFDVVDTDPASTTFLQVIASSQIPGAGGGFTIASACAVTPDDQFAIVLYSGIGPSAIAVMHVASQTLLDFDAGAPGQQDFVLPSNVANTMALAPSGLWLVVAGQGSGGWAGRVDLDWQNLANTTFTPFVSPNGLPNCNGASLSADGLRAAVTTTPVNLMPPSYLEVFDVLTGTWLSSTTLPGAWNVYTTAWQDASPVATYVPYGAGCTGSLGVPTLAAAAGTRPALGTTLRVEVDRVPNGVAIMATGLSNTTTGTLPLPLDLTPFGMAGCTLYAAPQSTALLLATGSTATWSWTIAAVPAFFGARFYNQAFVLDPSANATGLTVSNAGEGMLGY